MTTKPVFLLIIFFQVQFSQCISSIAAAKKSLKALIPPKFLFQGVNENEAWLETNISREEKLFAHIWIGKDLSTHNCSPEPGHDPEHETETKPTILSSPRISKTIATKINLIFNFNDYNTFSELFNLTSRPKLLCCRIHLNANKKQSNKQNITNTTPGINLHFDEGAKRVIVILDSNKTRHLNKSKLSRKLMKRPSKPEDYFNIFSLLGVTDWYKTLRQVRRNERKQEALKILNYFRSYKHLIPHLKFIHKGLGIKKDLTTKRRQKKLQEDRLAGPLKLNGKQEQLVFGAARPKLRLPVKHGNVTPEGQKVFNNFSTSLGINLIRETKVKQKKQKTNAIKERSRLHFKGPRTGLNVKLATTTLKPNVKNFRKTTKVSKKTKKNANTLILGVNNSSTKVSATKVTTQNREAKIKPKLSGNKNNLTALKNDSFSAIKFPLKTMKSSTLKTQKLGKLRKPKVEPAESSRLAQPHYFSSTEEKTSLEKNSYPILKYSDFLNFLKNKQEKKSSNFLEFKKTGDKWRQQPKPDVKKIQQYLKDFKANRNTSFVNPQKVSTNKVPNILLVHKLKEGSGAGELVLKKPKNWKNTKISVKEVDDVRYGVDDPIEIKILYNLKSKNSMRSVPKKLVLVLDEEGNVISSKKETLKSKKGHNVTNAKSKTVKFMTNSKEQFSKLKIRRRKKNFQGTSPSTTKKPLMVKNQMSHKNTIDIVNPRTAVKKTLTTHERKNKQHQKNIKPSIAENALRKKSSHQKEEHGKRSNSNKSKDPKQNKRIYTKIRNRRKLLRKMKKLIGKPQRLLRAYEVNYLTGQVDLVTVTPSYL